MYIRIYEVVIRSQTLPLRAIALTDDIFHFYFILIKFETISSFENDFLLHHLRITTEIPTSNVSLSNHARWWIHEKNYLMLHCSAFAQFN